MDICISVSMYLCIYSGKSLRFTEGLEGFSNFIPIGSCGVRVKLSIGKKVPPKVALTTPTGTPERSHNGPQENLKNRAEEMPIELQHVTNMGPKLLKKTVLWGKK